MKIQSVSYDSVSILNDEILKHQWSKVPQSIIILEAELIQGCESNKTINDFRKLKSFMIPKQYNNKVKETVGKITLDT